MAIIIITLIYRFRRFTIMKERTPVKRLRIGKQVGNLHMNKLGCRLKASTELEFFTARDSAFKTRAWGGHCKGPTFVDLML